MILIIAGMFMMSLGLFAGAALLLTSTGLLGGTPHLGLWALFPLLSLAGFVLFAIGGQLQQIRSMVMTAACLNLLLAGAAAVALVMAGASMLELRASSGGLWYLLCIGGLIGSFGAAATHRDDPKA
ncbi:hypothetical protein [Chitinimonas sp.]|uniref:hypothetical protein n=1 Tax=Chitinimonas sp. TaxID=1934313 RepID=UPI0035B352F2